MHPNRAFRHDDASFHRRMIDEIAFANIFLTTPDGPRVAHTPILCDDDDTLRFHLARTNALVPHLDGARALVVLNGPDAYISARWYGTDNRVPTWNYIAFELEGTVKRMDPDELPYLVENLSDHHEAKVKRGTPWTLGKMDQKAFAALLRGIVGFRMSIELVRETVKLAQHKSEEDYRRLIEGLEDEGSDAMARMMREFSR